MKLTDWLTKHDMTAAEFARRSGVSTPTLCRIIAGRLDPRASTVAAIEHATARQVKASDLLPDEKTA